MRGHKLAVMSFKEKYLIFDRVGATYVGELGHVFEQPFSVHIPRWCVVYCTFQWDVEVEILGLILDLVHNDGLHEAFPIGSVKYK